MKKKCCLVTNIMDSVSDYQQKLNRLERIKTSQYGPKTKQEFKESRNYFFKFLNWSIIALHCCISFCYTPLWISYMYTYITLHLESPSHATTQIPPYWVITEHGAEFGWLHMVVYICQSYFLNSSHPLLPTLCLQVHPLSLHLFSHLTNSRTFF